MWPLWKLFRSWGHFMLDSWIRHLCLRCLWFLTVLENSVLANKYQIFVSFSQGYGVFLPWVVCIRGSFTSKWYQIYPTIFWSGLPETVPQIGGRQKSNAWSLLEPELGVSLRWGGWRCAPRAPWMLLWNASTEFEKTTTMERHDPAVSPGCAALSATGHMSLFFLFALRVEASTASIDCTRPVDLTPATDNSLSFEL